MFKVNFHKNFDNNIASVSFEDKSFLIGSVFDDNTLISLKDKLITDSSENNNKYSNNSNSNYYDKNVDKSLLSGIKEKERGSDDILYNIIKNLSSYKESKESKESNDEVNIIESEKQQPPPGFNLKLDSEWNLEIGEDNKDKGPLLRNENKIDEEVKNKDDVNKDNKDIDLL